MRHAARRPAPAVPPGAPPSPGPSLLHRGRLSIDPDDWAWLHDLIRRRGEIRR